MEIKTTSKLSRKLKNFIIQKHPDDLPEVIEVHISDRSTQYLNWIEDSTQ